MAGIKQESLSWIDQIKDLKAYLKKKPSAKRIELREALKLSDGRITILYSIETCFDELALKKVRQAAKGASPFTLSSNAALALAKLKGRVQDFPKIFHQVLDFVLAQRLIPMKIEALVEWIIEGKPISGFDPTRVKRKSPKGPSLGPREVREEAAPIGNKSDVQTPGAAVGREGELPPQKPGEKPDWKGIREAIYGAATLVFIILFARCAWHDFKTWEGAQTHSDAAATPAVANNPSGSNEATNAGSKLEVRSEELGVKANNQPTSIQNSGAPAPVVAWNASLETETQMDNELFPLPDYCVIKPILPLPAVNMDAVKAGNLLALFQDVDKYSVWYGNERVTVESAPVNPAFLALFFKDKGPVEINWNTLKAIHCDEAQVFGEHTGETLYQCGLVSSGLEKAVEIECTALDDFNNLVSALFFWAKNVTPSGLPYLHQGTVFDSQALVKVVWAGSPADKAGLRLNDMVWGLDQDGDRQQKPIAVEKGLDALEAGRHALYVIRGGRVSPETPRTRLELMVP